METGKITIAIALIAMIGGWGTALITNWDNITGKVEEPMPAIGKDIEIKLQDKIGELNLLRKDMKEEQEKSKAQNLLLEEKNKELLEAKNKEIEELKIPFHQISNSKLKELLSFHNDAACYGRSLNFTHEPDESYSHCVSKEVLAKRILKFFEELEIIENNGGMDYSRARARSELINLQTQYNFNNPGWYTEFMLGILIIEYAKKA